ncbi:Large polyvalent protein-associated domain 7 [Comamonadaceae bacterium]
MTAEAVESDFEASERLKRARALPSSGIYEGSNVLRPEAEREALGPTQRHLSEQERADEIKVADAAAANARLSEELTSKMKTAGPQPAYQSMAPGSINSADARLTGQRPKPYSLPGYESNRTANGSIEYTNQQTKQKAFLDTGDRVQMSNDQDMRQEDLAAAVDLGSRKFNRISIVGRQDFRDRAAEHAGRMGLADRLANADLSSKAQQAQDRQKAIQHGDEMTSKILADLPNFKANIAATEARRLEKQEQSMKASQKSATEELPMVSMQSKKAQAAQLESRQGVTNEGEVGQELPFVSMQNRAGQAETRAAVTGESQTSDVVEESNHLEEGQDLHQETRAQGMSVR